MTSARIGYGSTYEIYSAGAWVPMAEVISLTPGEATADRVEATHMQSPGRRREFISGLIDNGSASLEINWIPGNATDTIIRGLLTSGLTTQHRMTFPTGDRVTFDAAITGFSRVIPIDDRMTATVEIAVSGEETWDSTVVPAIVLTPSISTVQARVGVLMTAVPGSWTGTPVFTYQWKKAGVNIAGATAATYTPVAGDLGAAITVSVTGTNTSGSSTATSAASANVVAA